MLEEVDQDIDRPIDGGQQVGGVSDVLYPQWPVNFLPLQPESYTPHSRSEIFIKITSEVVNEIMTPM